MANFVGGLVGSDHCINSSFGGLGERPASGSLVGVASLDTISVEVTVVASSGRQCLGLDTVESDSGSFFFTPLGITTGRSQGNKGKEENGFHGV